MSAEVDAGAARRPSVQPLSPAAPTTGVHVDTLHACHCLRADCGLHPLPLWPGRSPQRWLRSRSQRQADWGPPPPQPRAACPGRGGDTASRALGAGGSASGCGPAKAACP